MTAPLSTATTGSRPLSSRSNDRCHIRECSRPSKASRSVSSDRSSPAQKCSPWASSTTAFTPSGGALKNASMPSTVGSFSALRFAARVRRSTATSPSAPCRSTSSEGGSRGANRSVTEPLACPSAALVMMLPPAATPPRPARSDAGRPPGGAGRSAGSSRWRCAAARTGTRCSGGPCSGPGSPRGAPQLRLGDRRPVAHLHVRGADLAPPPVGDPDDGAVGHRVELHRDGLHLGRVHVLPTGDVHVFHPVDDVRPPVALHPQDVAGAEPLPVDEGGGGLLRAVPVAREDVRAAHQEL